VIPLKDDNPTETTPVVTVGIMITAALVSGAIVERMRFSAYLVFIALWSLLVYAPVAHWVWGGGWLATLGALDFAGGTVDIRTKGIPKDFDFNFEFGTGTNSNVSGTGYTYAGGGDDDRAGEQAAFLVQQAQDDGFHLRPSAPPAPRRASSSHRRTACGCCPCRRADCRRRRSRKPCCAS